MTEYLTNIMLLIIYTIVFCVLCFFFLTALSRVSDDLADVVFECISHKRTDILAFHLGHYHNRVMCEVSC